MGTTITPAAQQITRDTAGVIVTSTPQTMDEETQVTKSTTIVTIKGATAAISSSSISAGTGTVIAPDPTTTRHRAPETEGEATSAKPMIVTTRMEVTRGAAEAIKQTAGSDTSLNPASFCTTHSFPSFPSLLPDVLHLFVPNTAWAGGQRTEVQSET
mmetsp:Transcript_29085/g.53150  ORF Transcript_29085/g.53150 Transcript_29085/m.53150 type:complete len:157 (-) Transcript_29085:64-534(-)